MLADKLDAKISNRLKKEYVIQPVEFVSEIYQNGCNCHNQVNQS